MSWWASAFFFFFFFVVDVWLDVCPLLGSARTFTHLVTSHLRLWLESVYGERKHSFVF